VAAGESVVIEEQVLSEAARLEERLFMGLRLTQGVSRPAIEAEFGVDPWRRRAEQFAPFLAGGFMWADETSFGLTRTGMLLANEVLSAVL
jgi:coproporphyrinogen III oxidase-like Fe-S oxidoreductase